MPILPVRDPNETNELHELHELMNLAISFNIDKTFFGPRNFCPLVEHSIGPYDCGESYRLYNLPDGIGKPILSAGDIETFKRKLKEAVENRPDCEKSIITRIPKGSGMGFDGSGI